jgi:hypothetical protein
MSNTKQLADKINMFCNLVYHIDDYIHNVYQKKDQTYVSKNIRLVLREVISSKINLKFFINKEEVEPSKNEKILEEKFQKENKYIKKINPLSFNQKNLGTINLFYNSNNEMYVINYLSVEKIFSIIQYCFKNILKQKNIEIKKRFERQNKNFVLYDTQSGEINYNVNTKENNANNTINVNKTVLINKLLINKSKPRKEYNNINSVNIFSILNQSYKLNNIRSFLNNNSNIKNNYLKKRIRLVKQINSSSKIRIVNPLIKKSLKRNISLPMINQKKLINLKNSCYSKDKINII